LGILSSLNREQKEAVGLLQIGTFLEYFDLMLYVHMAVLLNELFFPKTDPHTAALLTAFAFCSTYVLRPFGALIFGYIGDNIGRKTTVIITTMMMSISCVIMANVPTYAEIGIAAAWIITFCRVFQGLSSMGEVMGAKIYVTEIVKPPAQYPAVTFIVIASSLGTVCALGFASLVTNFGFSWRIAFWIGAGIAVVGSIARTRLRETPEFLQLKRSKLKQKPISNLNAESTNIQKKDLISYIGVECGWPFCFYLGYMYLGFVLKNEYGFSAKDVIFCNFILALITLTSDFVLAFLSYRIHPLRIIKCKGWIFLCFAFLLPFLIVYSNDYRQIFILQAIILFIPLAGVPADSIFIKYVPVFCRFTAVTFIYAISRAAMYVITSFGLVYLTGWFGHYGLLIIMIPVIISFLYGVNHFIKLEKEAGNFPSSRNPDKIAVA
jgi:MFS family permease